MIRPLFWLFALFLSGPAFSEPVAVQVGENDGYTRLVFTLPEAADWRVENQSSGVSVTIPSATSYEWPTVPDGGEIARINATRTNGIGDTLEISFNCACTSNSFALNDRFLAIDISERVENAAPSAFPNTIAALAKPWLNSPVFTEPKTAISDAPPLHTSGTSLLSSTISRGLSAATYQGFLSLSSPSRSGETAVNEESLDAEVLNNIAIGVQAQLSTLTEPLQADSETAFPCEEVYSALMSRWEDRDSFNLQFGQLRQIAAISETEFDPSTAIDVATLFIGFGMGVEAQRYLEFSEDQTALVTALSYMAHVIDGTSSPVPIGLEACIGTLSFWGFLAHSGQHQDATPQSLLRTFKFLPPMLRARLAEPFADALERAGHGTYLGELEDFKNTTVASIAVETETTPASFQLEERAPPDAIIRAAITQQDLETGIPARRDPTSLDLPLLETMRFERRSTPAEYLILEEELSRHVANAEYAQVVGILRESEARLTEEQYSTLSARFLSQSVAQMTDAELVSFSYQSDLPPLTKAIEDQVGQRLSELGISAPRRFQKQAESDDSVTRSANAPDPDQSEALDIANFRDMLIVETLPSDEVPTFAASESLLQSSAAMRNTIETFIMDTE